MKRKIILFSALLLVCAGLYAIYRRYNRVEDKVLKNITFSDSSRYIVDLCEEHKIPIVLEGLDHHSEYGGAKTNVYSAEKITVRQILDKIVPKNFMWTSNGRVIHIIDRQLAAQPDYQMNTVIERFVAWKMDRNMLIHMAVAEAKKGAAPEPLAYYEFPFEQYGYKKPDLPKISINRKGATLREILDEISLKADFCYDIERAKHPFLVPGGSYGRFVVVVSDLKRRKELLDPKK